MIKILESKLSLSTKGNPGEITEINNDGIVVRCADKSVVITRVKPSGKKEMSAKDFVNGQGKDKLLKEVFE